MSLNLPLTIKVFYEGTSKEAPYVAFNPEFRVASAGKTKTQAKRNLKEAVHGFLKTCKDIGSLEEILNEGGFILKNKIVKPEEAEIKNFRISVPVLS